MSPTQSKAPAPRRKEEPTPPMPPIVDQGVPPSEDTPVPRLLIWVYCFLPILGLILLYLFWDGSFGWFDRGAWSSLQQVANTK